MTPRAGFTFGTKNPAWPKKVEPYLDALRYSGLEPVLLLPGDDRNGLEAFVIGGGTDIDPARYGDARAPETEDPDAPRDQLESAVLQAALARNLPVLAICRGLQMFHVVHGGKLAQHIEGHTQPGVHDAHEVTVAPETQLHRITGANGFAVNSRHHQGVIPAPASQNATVGANAIATPASQNPTATAPAIAMPASLIISARAQDGTIEALERADLHFAIAVQWHPEDRVRTSDADRRLFQAFAAACRSAHRATCR